MSESVVVTHHRSSPPRPWRTIGLVLALMALLAVAAGAWLVVSRRGGRALAEARAEADRVSPGWRHEDLEAARRPVPDSRNSALCVRIAGELIPAEWPGQWGENSPAGGALVAAIERHASGQCLKAEDVQSLRTALAASAPALSEARDLADLSEGRYPIHWSADTISTPLPHVHIMRNLATVLSYEAARQALEGDVEGALITCRALINTGRSIGDEPLIVSQLSRTLVLERACGQVEFALAHGEPSDATLVLLAHSLDREAGMPGYLPAIRGERAMCERFSTCIESGEITPKQLRDMSLSFGHPIGDAPGAMLFAATAKETHAALLRYFARALEIAELPWEEQAVALIRLEETARQMPRGARLIAPSFGPFATSCRRTRARLHCASSALAAERYRRARGSWPSSLEDLVPDFLAEVPTDPFDGMALRFRRLDDGISLESASAGAGDRDGGRKGSDARSAAGKGPAAFRLWDVARRHLPAHEQAPGRR